MCFPFYERQNPVDSENIQQKLGVKKTPTESSPKF